MLLIFNLVIVIWWCFGYDLGSSGRVSTALRCMFSNPPSEALLTTAEETAEWLLFHLWTYTHIFVALENKGTLGGNLKTY